jgi:hypothetical protein
LRMRVLIGLCSIFCVDRRRDSDREDDPLHRHASLSGFGASEQAMRTHDVTWLADSVVMLPASRRLQADDLPILFTGLLAQLTLQRREGVTRLRLQPGDFFLQFQTLTLQVFQSFAGEGHLVIERVKRPLVALLGSRHAVLHRLQCFSWDRCTGEDGEELLGFR